MNFSYEEISSDQTIACDKSLYWIDCTSNDVDITLPDMTSPDIDGIVCNFRRLDSNDNNVCRLVASSGQTIGDSSSVVLQTFTTMSIIATVPDLDYRLF